MFVSGAPGLWAGRDYETKTKVIGWDEGPETCRLACQRTPGCYRYSTATKYYK